MQIKLWLRFWLAAVALPLLLLTAGSLTAADTLSWNTNKSVVSADIQSVTLPRLLQGVAQLTGWKIFLEPGSSRDISAKFKDRPQGEALRILLGDLNFVLLPGSNESPALLVFRTARQNATQFIHAADLNATNSARAKIIANELIVRVKPGVNIDELAKKLGAKVIGKIDGLNAYRLQFEDAAAADSARQQLAGNADVAAVESNYVIDPPPTAAKLDPQANPNLPAPLQLKLNPPADSGHVIVGLVDTAWQAQGNDLDKFMLKTLSVAGDSNPDPSVPTHATFMYQDILRGAANVEGGGSSLQVLSVNVFGPNPTANTFDVANGIATAINNGANVINLSLGSPNDSPVLQDIIQQAIAKGIPVFAAAGNDGSSELYFPAAYPGVTSVTASSQGQLAPYANYGTFVKLIAPGSSVGYFGSSAYLVTGTSGATALVSGLTAGLADSKGVSPGAAANAVQNTPSLKFTPMK